MTNRRCCVPTDYSERSTLVERHERLLALRDGEDAETRYKLNQAMGLLHDMRLALAALQSPPPPETPETLRDQLLARFGHVEHRCGVRGFAESGDQCPGCVLAGRAQPEPGFRYSWAKPPETADTPLPPIEVRMATLDDGREQFAEVVASNASVHLEKMGNCLFALIIETVSERACFQIFSKNWRSHIDGNTFWHERKPAPSLTGEDGRR